MRSSWDSPAMIMDQVRHSLNWNIKIYLAIFLLFQVDLGINKVAI